MGRYPTGLRVSVDGTLILHKIYIRFPIGDFRLSWTAWPIPAREGLLEILRTINEADEPGWRTGRVHKMDAADLSRVSSHIPTGCLAIGTACCIPLVVIHVILMKRGIFVNTSFAGVVLIGGGRATDFSDMIASPLDPINISIAKRMAMIAEVYIRGIRSYPREREGDPL
ncbi:MAG: DUF128 domain-containing protein [Methanotrichaceae archaeon]|nr:DUF128 domain-containing protein [Methanotrichaceae archaeon]